MFQKLTNTSFVEWNNKKIYKTGDICQIGYDLKTYCIGRIDHQVKLNGIRIELDEISRTICNIDEIKEAIVIDKNVNNKTFLIAYYTSQQILNEQKIKLELEKKLPLYMIPNKFIKLDEFPMTPNQQIDRKKIESFEIKFN